MSEKHVPSTTAAYACAPCWLLRNLYIWRDTIVATIKSIRRRQMCRHNLIKRLNHVGRRPKFLRPPPVAPRRGSVLTPESRRWNKGSSCLMCGNFSAACKCITASNSLPAETSGLWLQIIVALFVDVVAFSHHVTLDRECKHS